MTAAMPPYQQRHPFAPGTAPGQPRAVPGSRPPMAPLPGRIPPRVPGARPVPGRVGSPAPGMPPGLRPQVRPVGPPMRPQQQGPALQQVQQQAPAQPYAEGTTVLIVDDHRIVREGLRHFVAEVPGVTRVLTAASGEEALARYDAERPDLVLMDIQMPGLGGLEALKLIRTHPDFKKLPVVMMSGARPLVKQADYGWSAFLTKPFNSDDLLDLVRKLI